MNDRELLELAAKAARLDHLWVVEIDGISPNWNPLTDDGDALRLAVKLELTEVWFDKSTGRPEVVCGKHGTGICVEPLRDDPCAAARRSAKIIRPEPDCRTCARCYSTKGRGVYGCDSVVGCTNGDRYQPLPPVQLWRTP